MSLGRQPQEDDQVFNGDYKDSFDKEETNENAGVNDRCDNQEISQSRKNNCSNFEEEKEQYRGDNIERLEQLSYPQGIPALDSENILESLDNFPARNISNEAYIEASQVANQRRGIAQQLALKGILERSYEQCNSNNSSSENRRSFSQNYGNSREQQKIMNNVHEETSQEQEEFIQDQYPREDLQWNQGNANVKNSNPSSYVRSSSYDNDSLIKNPKDTLNKNNTNIKNNEAYYTGSFNEHMDNNMGLLNRRFHNINNPNVFTSELSQMDTQQKNQTNQRKQQELEKYWTKEIQGNHSQDLRNEKNSIGNIRTREQNEKQEDIYSLIKNDFSRSSQKETFRNYEMAGGISKRVSNRSQKNDNNLAINSKSYANAMRALQEKIRQLESQLKVDIQLQQDMKQQWDQQTEQYELEISLRIQESREYGIRIEELEGELVESRSETLELSRLFDSNVSEKADLFNKMENEIQELKKELIRSQQTLLMESQEKAQLAEQYARCVGETDELKSKLRQCERQLEEQIMIQNGMQTKLTSELAQKEAVAIRLDKISRESERQRMQNNEQLHGFQNDLFNLEQGYLNKISVLEGKCCDLSDDSARDKQRIQLLERDLRETQNKWTELRQGYEERKRKMMKEQRYLKKQIDEFKQDRAQGDDEQVYSTFDESKGRKNKGLQQPGDDRAGRSVSFNESCQSEEKNEVISGDTIIEGNQKIRSLTPQGSAKRSSQKQIQFSAKDRQEQLINHQHSQNQAISGLNEQPEGNNTLENSQNSNITRQQYAQSHQKYYSSGDKRVNVNSMHASHLNSSSLNGQSQFYHQSQQPSNNVSYYEASHVANQGDSEKYEYVLKQIIESEKEALMLSNQFQFLLAESTKAENSKKKHELRGRLIEINELINKNNQKLFGLKKQEHECLDSIS